MATNIDYLQNLGLNENQAKTYLTLLTLGKATVLQISRDGGINRTTIYENLRVLKSLNLVTTGIEFGKTYYYAESPNNLKELIDKREAESNNLISNLYSIFNTNSLKPKISFFDDKTGYIKMHNLSLIGNSKRRTRYIGDVNTLFLALKEEFIKDYVKRRIKTGITNQVITTSNIIERKHLYNKQSNLENLRQIKYIPNIGEIKTALFNYDDVVWITPTPTQKFLIMIENPEFAETFNSLFDALWGIGLNVE